MESSNRRPTWLLYPLLAVAGVVGLGIGLRAPESAPAAEAKDEYSAAIRPLIVKFCLDCHSTKIMKGELDLERFASIEIVRQDLNPWQSMIEQLEAGEMPPKEKPQPSADER